MNESEAIKIAEETYIFQNTGDWRKLRIAIAGKSAREMGPVVVGINTGCRSSRVAGQVAIAIRNAAVALGMEHKYYTPATWASKWRRTKRAKNNIIAMEEVFETAKNYLVTVAGSNSSYTSRLENARVFTDSEVWREKCGNEIAIKVEDLF